MSWAAWLMCVCGRDSPPVYNTHIRRTGSFFHIVVLYFSSVCSLRLGHPCSMDESMAVQHEDSMQMPVMPLSMTQVLISLHGWLSHYDAVSASTQATSRQSTHGTTTHLTFQNYHQTIHIVCTVFVAIFICTASMSAPPPIFIGYGHSWCKHFNIYYCCTYQLYTGQARGRL